MAEQSAVELHRRLYEASGRGRRSGAGVHFEAYADRAAPLRDLGVSEEALSEFRSGTRG